jgi:hypothetical protein
MTKLHHFAVKEELQIAALWNVLVAVQELEYNVDAWIEEHSIRNFIKTDLSPCYPRLIDLPTGVQKNVMVGFEAPTWSFYNELDALQFKLAWGESFDYCVLGE